MKFKTLSLPPIIKPREIPIGASVVGRLIAVTPSPKKEYKSNILTFECVGGKSDGRKFALPETAVIRMALDSEGGASALIGKILVIKHTGSKPSSDPEKRAARLFEVAIEA